MENEWDGRWFHQLVKLEYFFKVFICMLPAEGMRAYSNGQFQLLPNCLAGFNINLHACI